MEPFSINEPSTLARIVAIGVGDSGKNIINYMTNKNKLGIELIITDRGDQDYTDLRESFLGANIVFIVVGLGGATGVHTLPSIAKIAKSVGALTIGVVSRPFSIEGTKCLEVAEEALVKLSSATDSIVVIPNDKLLSIMNPELLLKEAFQFVDDVFVRVITGISGVIVPSGENDISIDLVDLRTIMRHRGIAQIGIGEYQGGNAAYEAMVDAMKFAIVDSMSIKNACGILVHFNTHPDFIFMELCAAMDMIHRSFDESTEIIFGTTTDESLPLDFVRIILIGTGLDKIKIMAANNVY